jgi:protease-4
MAEVQSAAGASRTGTAGLAWERELLERLALEAVREQRRARRWGIFFKLILVAYVAAILAMSWPGLEQARTLISPHTALVDVQGLIAEHATGAASTVISGLREAFEDTKAKGVIIRINSPGGSPVQASYIYDEIKRLKAKHPDTPVYAVITDVCASGGYYVAAAADRIYADPSSIVGSIGVRMDSFGFVGAMEKLGVERRLLTAGEHKALLDPFSPANPEEVAHVERMLEEIHGQFIAKVRAGRGDRLGGDESVFSGLIWAGTRAKEIGLVDELAGTDHVAREVLGAEKTVNYTHKPDYLERLADRFGIAIGEGLAMSLGGSLRVQ